MTRINGTGIMKEDEVARYCSSPPKSSFGTNAPSSSSIYNLDESSSDLAEDCGMTSSSRASTLDRIYAREEKLYDEVKVIFSCILCDTTFLKFKPTLLLLTFYGYRKWY